MVTIEIEVSDELMADIKKYAEAGDLSVSDFMIEAINDHIGELESMGEFFADPNNYLPFDDDDIDDDKFLGFGVPV